MMPVRWRQLVWAVVLLSYALLVHYSNLGPAPPMLAAVLALALWRRRALPNAPHASRRDRAQRLR